MKTVRMKGKTKEEAVKVALEVLGCTEEQTIIKVVTEGKAGMLGMIGGEEAEVEVILKGTILEDAIQILQEILDKMQLMAVADGTQTEGNVDLVIKGEDMGRIIGKDGATIFAFETLVRAILGRLHNERVYLNIDAADYKKKRISALERLAAEAADEVVKTGQETVLPPMSASDRRAIHLSLQENLKVKTYSQGEGKERRLVIAPK